MVDVHQQVDYWRRGADEDWDVAVKLVKDGNTRHGLFFAHLALEKMLKALVCRLIRRKRRTTWLDPGRSSHG